ERIGGVYVEHRCGLAFTRAMPSAALGPQGAALRGARIVQRVQARSVCRDDGRAGCEAAQQRALARACDAFEARRWPGAGTCQRTGRFAPKPRMTRTVAGKHQAEAVVEIPGRDAAAPGLAPARER